MLFFDKKFSFFILLFTIPLLFLPKINLINFDGSETAGIRIDDIILFFLAVVLIWAHFLLDKKMFKIEGWIFILTGFSLLSFALNKLFVFIDVLHVNASVFYALRLFEYFLFFYVGAFAAQLWKGNRAVRLFFMWNLILMILQKFNLIGGVTSEGYAQNVSHRVQGIASFPSEMGLLLNLLFCYLIYDDNQSSRSLKFFTSSACHILRKFYLYWMFAIFSVLIILTGNRISILALLVCFLAKLRTEVNLRSATSLIAISVVSTCLFIGAFFLISQTEAVYKRSADLFAMRNLTLVEAVWNQIDLNKEPIGNEVVASDDYDISWWLRIHKWIYALKMYASHPENYLQGIGPGFTGAALDGGLLRILTEYGLIGCFIFWNFFSILYRLNPQLKWMTIAFTINMIFFDAYLAYKTMSFLFFAGGHVHGLKHKKNAQSALSPAACSVSLPS